MIFENVMFDIVETCIEFNANGSCVYKSVFLMIVPESIIIASIIKSDI